MIGPLGSGSMRNLGTAVLLVVQCAALLGGYQPAAMGQENAGIPASAASSTSTNIQNGFVADKIDANYVNGELRLMLPKKDGFALATQIRKKNALIPIIMLTAKNMDEDKIHAEMQEKKKKPKKQGRFQKKMADMMEQAEKQKQAQQKRK